MDRLLLSMVFHCSKDDSHSRGVKTLEETFSCKYGGVIPLDRFFTLMIASVVLSNADAELGNVPISACMTVDFISPLLCRANYSRLSCSFFGDLGASCFKRRSGPQPRTGTFSAVITCSASRPQSWRINAIGRPLCVTSSKRSTRKLLL